MKTVAFRNEDGSKVLLALNQAGAPRTLVVRARGPWFTATLPPGAVATMRWE